MTDKQSVVATGGGPAGLTAAQELIKDDGVNKYGVTVLKGTREFGGISRTVKHSDNRVDIGDHRSLFKDERIIDWWKTALPLQGVPSYDDKKLGHDHDMKPGGPSPETENKVMLKHHRVSRILWNHRFFDYPVSLSPNTLKAMGSKLTMMVGFSYLKSVFHKLPEDNLENFCINRFNRKPYSMFFESYTEKPWGHHPPQISADWSVQRTKGLFIMGVLKNAFQKLLSEKRFNAEVETSLIEGFWYPKYGPGQLWKTVKSSCEAAGAKVLTDTRVAEVHQTDGAVFSVVYEGFEGSRTELSDDQFVSSMSVKDLINAIDAAGVDPEAVDPRPTLADMIEVANDLPHRSFVTVGLLVRHPKPKNTTGTPTLDDPPTMPNCWTYVQGLGYKVGRLQIFDNWSPYLVRGVDDTVRIGLEYFCEEDDSLWNMSEGDVTKFTASGLTRMRMVSGPDGVIDSHRERVRRTYPAYFDTYEHMDELIECLDGFGNLCCVGRNSQYHCNNMDHSMATTMEAVGNTKTGKTPKEDVWSINAKKSYYEKR